MLFQAIQTHLATDMGFLQWPHLDREMLWLLNDQSHCLLECFMGHRGGAFRWQILLLKISDVLKRRLTVGKVRTVVVRRSIEFLHPAFLHAQFVEGRYGF